MCLARTQAKYALPRGGGPAPRTTRIFVARIPLSVSDVQFRQYFEQFGHVQVGCRFAPSLLRTCLQDCRHRACSVPLSARRALPCFVLVRHVHLSVNKGCHVP